MVSLLAALSILNDITMNSPLITIPKRAMKPPRIAAQKVNRFEEESVKQQSVLEAIQYAPRGRMIRVKTPVPTVAAITVHWFKGSCLGISPRGANRGRLSALAGRSLQSPPSFFALDWSFADIGDPSSVSFEQNLAQQGLTRRKVLRRQRVEAGVVDCLPFSVAGWQS